MKIRRAMLLSLGIVHLASLHVPAKAQAVIDLANSAGTVASVIPAKPVPVYTRPTQQIKLHNYVFDAFGPYPIAGAAIVAGIGQVDNTPLEWKQGAAGYSRRFGSDVGIAAISTTTRYALAQAFKEDTLYYRCECKGVLPRLRHAVISTCRLVTAKMATASFLFLR